MLREIVLGLFFLLSLLLQLEYCTSCALMDLNLNNPPWPSVFYYFASFEDVDPSSLFQAKYYELLMLSFQKRTC